MNYPTVQLLPRKALDLERWDAAVRRAPYGLSWWLDAVTGSNWYGVVLDDYRAVLPVPISRSIGPVKLVNGAPFTQHQGPFGEFSDREFYLMLTAIPRLWYLRKLNLYPPLPDRSVLKNLAVSARTNHELSLRPTYETLLRGYRGNTRRKIRDFPATDLEEWSLPKFLTFYEQHAGPKAGLNAAALSVLRKLTTQILEHQVGNCYHLTGEEGETIAAILLVRYRNRFINLLAASSPAGFEQHGMTRLLDGIIRAHSGTDTILDFEGSDLIGVALFFRGFGAERITYWTVG